MDVEGRAKNSSGAGCVSTSTVNNSGVGWRSPNDAIGIRGGGVCGSAGIGGNGGGDVFGNGG